MPAPRLPAPFPRRGAGGSGAGIAVPRKSIPRAGPSPSRSCEYHRAWRGRGGGGSGRAGPGRSTGIRGDSGGPAGEGGGCPRRRDAQGATLSTWYQSSHRCCFRAAAPLYLGINLWPSPAARLCQACSPSLSSAKSWSDPFRTGISRSDRLGPREKPFWPVWLCLRSVEAHGVFGTVRCRGMKGKGRNAASGYVATREDKQEGGYLASAVT